MFRLANVDAMKLNGYTPDQVKDNLSNIVLNISGGLVVTMESGGGVYADVADHCGNYNAQVTIDNLEYSGASLSGMKAQMQISGQTTTYLSSLGNAVKAAGNPVQQGEGAQVMPVTDMFGYIIDLAFRTNAAASDLLLQTDAANRIYEDQAGVTLGEDETSTMGGGSTMTFKATTTDFTVAQMVELMKAIRVVFFNPSDSTVLEYAKLNLTEGEYTTSGGNTVTASLYLYETSEGGTKYNKVNKDTVTVPDGETTYYTESDGTYTPVTDENFAAWDENTDYYTAEEVLAGEYLITTPADAVITDLTQNEAKAVSVLVYLDGNNVGNDDVAATAATSMTGSLNLQFASSANLVPMNYTPLMEQTGTTTGGDTTGGTTTGGETTDDETQNP